MREFARRVSVFLFIVAFVFSGAAWAACVDLPVAPASGTTVFIGHDHAGGHNGRHLVTGEENADASDQGPATHGHGAVVKCCSMAPVFNLAPDLVVRPVAFSRPAAVFRFVQRGMIGHIVALEPGIPKSIV